LILLGCDFVKIWLKRFNLSKKSLKRKENIHQIGIEYPNQRELCHKEAKPAFALS
jgi:hypothetical protein